MKKVKINERKVKEILLMNPTISSVDELCAVKNYEIDSICPESIEMMKYLINRNRLRLQVLLKQELYQKTDLKSREQLYKMICDEEELKRFGINPKGQVTNNIKPTIEIKSADPDIIDKIGNL